METARCSTPGCGADAVLIGYTQIKKFPVYVCPKCDGCPPNMAQRRRAA